MLIHYSCRQIQSLFGLRLLCQTNQTLRLFRLLQTRLSMLKHFSCRQIQSLFARITVKLLRQGIHFWLSLWLWLLLILNIFLFEAFGKVRNAFDGAGEHLLLAELASPLEPDQVFQVVDAVVGQVLGQLDPAFRLVLAGFENGGKWILV